MKKPDEHSVELDECIQPVIGLEVHCQLDTDSRLFSGGPIDVDAAPNEAVVDYDLGLPGVLPVLNRRAVEFALRVGIALECTIHRNSSFDRKHYFYPDLPKGYQITQYRRPLCTDGTLRFDVGDATGDLSIRRIHLEEDAGKSVHDSDGETTRIDYNRAGVPLIEIVTEPTLHSPHDAEAALRALHRLVVELGVCDGNLQEGSFRCDANVSLRRTDTDEKPFVSARTELKNLNSFRFVRRALAAEIDRRRRLGGGGGDETRSYDPDADRTRPMRTKEDSPDYRYMPDPDLPELVVDDEEIERIERELPELPRRRRQRFVDDYGLSGDDAGILAFPGVRADFFERAVEAFPSRPEKVANLVIHELLGHIESQTTVAELGVDPHHVARVVELVDEGTISSTAASELVEELLICEESPDEIVERRDLQQLADVDKLRDIVDEVLHKEPDLVDDYRDGKTKLFGHFMGQIMQASEGKADPEKTSRILRERLEDDSWE